MRKVCFVSTAVLVLAAGASAGAADLPRAQVYKAPPLAAGYNWTGFYLGANAGYGWGSSDAATTTVFSPAGYFAASSVPAIAAVGAQTVNSNGFTGGGQAGYNLQTGNIVWGVEVDFNYFGLTGSTSGSAVYPCCAPTTFTVNSSVKTDWLLTARPRIGYASGNWLFYATGGLAVTNLKGSFTFTDTFAAAAESASFNTTKAGWTAGAGVEVGLGGNWTAKAEYLYVDFGSVSVSSSNLVAPAGTAWPMSGFTHSADLKANIVRAGLNYRF